MKLSIALLGAAAALSAAKPHRHGHQHLHQRNPDAVDVVTVPGPTEIVYVLNGMLISESDVQQGIKNGSLVFADNGQLSIATSEVPKTYAPPPPPTTTSTSTSTSTSTPPPPPTTTSVYVAPTTSTSETPTSSATPSPSPSASSGSSWGSSGTGVDSDFPDGELDCSEFPSDYGAVAVDWQGLGGWTGIQCPAGQDGAGFFHIDTKNPGGSCSEGDYCSYACPAGYQKTQWPATQGSTGQSVGGLLCQNGKLKLTNSAMSSKLCTTGTSAVNVQVVNNLSQNVAICRTDYPGTEAETVPVDAPAGGNTSLACPEADNYYKWQGGSTSAQYYVNPAGVSVEDACTWGSSGSPKGNWAPVNLGVGYSNGAAWLSIFQNYPTTEARLDFCVTIEGDGVSGTCKYSTANQMYCSGEDYSDCNYNSGCTVSISSGTATFTFSD